MSGLIVTVLFFGLLIFKGGFPVECAKENINLEDGIVDDDEGAVQVEDELNLHKAKEEAKANKDLDPEEEIKPTTSSYDVETFMLFVEPAGTKDLTAGRIVKFLVSFYNKGNEEFLLERVDVSFRYPMDYSFYIQNYTYAIYNRLVSPGTEATFDYSFVPNDAYIGRPLGLSINLHYFNSNKTHYFNSVFNETVNIIEDESGFNPETGFLYVVFGCLYVLLLVLGQQFLSKMRKKHGMTKRPIAIEMGTNKNGDIDYDWIPKELLQMNKKAQAVTIKDFQKIADKVAENRSVLVDFVDTHFNPPGTDLEECFPDDWKENLLKLNDIKDERYRFWANKLHFMWKDLCRQAKVDVYENPELYSLLYVPNRFIVPGGRFREFYYWDSYWIIKGLLYSEMHSTVKGMIKNFAYMVEHYGFVPNGGRVYYLLRSQPPLLIPMVYEYYQATGDLDFVRQILPILVNEYKFWTSRRSTQYRDSATLFQYKVDMKNPRPESFREDMELVRHLTSASDKERVWSNIASAAETGWDFSSRWFAHEGASAHRLSTVRTWSIIPVDLNAFMCMNARMLSEIFKIKGDSAKAALYEARYMQGKMLMKQMHWNETDGTWYDYDLERHMHVDAYYISNALPLFAGCYDLDNETIPLRVYQYMKATGAFNSTKGIPTSFIQSDQQWDSANSWPPMVHMIIEGFRQSKSAQLQKFAQELASNWLQANYLAFEKTKTMWEKYDCSESGAGSGGEYEVQRGFGWTNGVVLDLLRTYGGSVHSPDSASESLAASTPTPVDVEPSVPQTLASAVYELIVSVMAPTASTSEEESVPSTSTSFDEETIEIDSETPEPPPPPRKRCKSSKNGAHPVVNAPLPSTADNHPTFESSSTTKNQVPTETLKSLTNHDRVEEPEITDQHKKPLYDDLVEKSCDGKHQSTQCKCFTKGECSEMDELISGDYSLDEESFMATKSTVQDFSAVNQQKIESSMESGVEYKEDAVDVEEHFLRTANEHFAESEKFVDVDRMVLGDGLRKNPDERNGIREL